MLLTVDIGNTTVAVAGFVGERPAFLRRLPAGREEGPRDWAAALRALLAGAGPFRGAALSSVVPALTGPVADALACVTGGRVLTVGRDTPTGLPLGDYDGAALGMDRVVDCVAALARYGGPVAVFDMGTATTLSAADKNGVFLGGMILPGLALSLEALSAKAAQLPPITLTPPEGLMGTDTVSCMKHGALYGAAGAIEGIVRRLERAYGPLTVVLTGGNSTLVRPLLEISTAWEPNLTFLGLAEIWRRNQC